MKNRTIKKEWFIKEDGSLRLGATLRLGVMGYLLFTLEWGAAVALILAALMDRESD